MTRRGLFVAPFDALSDPRVLAGLAADAEQAGWDGVFVWDHLLYREPVRAIADPWISCAAIACATTRILFGPMVTPLPRRRPQVLARQAVTLDRLSGGRLVLGFGLGDDGPGELSRFGDEVDARRRGLMLDEGLAVLQGLLSGETVDHDGELLQARGVQFLPAPDRPIPIWIAGRWPNAAPLRRAARFDGAFIISVPGPDDLGDVQRRLAAHRDSSAGPGELVVDLPPDADPSPWAAAGATWVLTRIGPYDLSSDRDLEEARRVARAGP